MNGITIYINGIGYWFEDSDRLVELLDMNCNNAASHNVIENGVVYDD